MSANRASAELGPATSTPQTYDNEKDLAVVEDRDLGGEEELDPDEQRAAKAAFQGEEEFTEEEYKKLLRKIDWILMPIMWWLYGVQQTDKLGVGTMNLFGLQKDTGMHGQQFALLTTLFYTSYAVFEFPCMALLQRYNVGKGLTIFVFLWGIVVFVQGFFNNWGEFAAFRFLQGILECTISPGFNIIVACWYTTREHSSRSLIFQSSNAGWGIIVNLVFYGIAERAKTHPGDFAVWRSITLFLGAQTIVAAAVSWYTLGTPNEVRWLTPRERAMANARIMGNHFGTDLTGKKRFDWNQVKEAFMDPVLYFQFVNTFLGTVPNGAISTFGTVVTSAFGFDKYETLLLVIPRDAWNIIWFALVGWTSLKYRNVRMYWMLISTILPCICFLLIALLPATPHYKVAKISVYCLTSAYTIPVFSAWALISSNTAGKTKFTVISAAVFIAYCTGSIAGSQVMRAKDAPHYTPGVVAVAICMAVNIGVIIAWMLWLRYSNRKKRLAIEAEGISPEEVERRAQELGARDVTDVKNPYFFYSM